MQAKKRPRHVVQRWFDVRQRWWSAQKAQEAKERKRPDRKRPPNLGSDRVVPAKV